MLEEGTRVGGFRVEQVLGRGGMAIVYRAIQLRLDRPVALKVLNPALAADHQFVQRFQLEGVNSARLEHPHIVPVYEAGEEGGHVFLAMKLVDGETLGALLHRRGALPGDEALPILADIAKALDHAHGRGFIHRDVKPGNVLLEAEGHVYLSDFGLSKAVGTRGITSTGQWMGTAEYMAPEQAQAVEVDYRADLYAFGCVAFECLTGDPPFLADTPLAVMMAHATQDIPSATARNLSLTPSVDEVMRRAMAKQPSGRYASALDVVEALAAAMEERRLTSDAEPADGQRRFGPRRTRPPEPPPTQPAGDWPTSTPPVPAVDTGPDPSVLFCPSCVDRVDPGDRFCGSCGSPLGWCRSCSGPMLAADRFCPHCGTPVS